MKCNPKYALVTGASSRIGNQISRRLLALDYKLIAHYSTGVQAIAPLADLNATIVQADFSEPQQVLTLADEIKNMVPYLNVLIHNAGCFAVTEQELSHAMEQYMSFFNVHMMAPFLLNTALQELLFKCPEKHSDIIQLSDIYALRPDPQYAIYCSTKAGLDNLTLSFAQQFAPKVKVNGIQPGAITFADFHTQDDKKAVLERTLLQEEGGVDCIASTVEYILANDYLTGSIVKVDGGRSII